MRLNRCRCCGLGPLRCLDGRDSWRTTVGHDVRHRSDGRTERKRECGPGKPRRKSRPPAIASAELTVAQRGFDVSGLDRVRVFGKGCEQRLVRYEIDTPGEAARS